MLRTTGASNTTTFNVGFTLLHIEGRGWRVAPPLAWVRKGYRNSQDVYYYIPPNWPALHVELSGSANPRGGTTPKEFIDDPLGKAVLRYEGPFPIPDAGELEQLAAEGIRELAQYLPGRFCPWPPLQDHWASQPRFWAEEALELGRKLVGGPARPSWWGGEFLLQGRVEGGLRQRAFYASTHLPAWRALLFHCPPSGAEVAVERHYLSGRPFHLGHHWVEVEGSAVKALAALSWRRDGHEFAQVLIQAWAGATLRVVDEATREVAEARISGNILLVHWPRLGADLD